MYYHNGGCVNALEYKIQPTSKFAFLLPDVLSSSFFSPIWVLQLD